MWENHEVKYRGWHNLKGKYWKSFLVGLVVYFASSEGFSNVVEKVSNIHLPVKDQLQTVIIVAGISVAMIMLKVFLLNPLHVGGMKYYLDLPKGESVSSLTQYYTGGHYSNVIKVTFLRGLKVFLYSLLLIIPGVIKSYQYCFVGYIVAENPEISTNEALLRSTELTEGHKVNIWILELTFIGWFLLGIICFGWGIVFVHPYYYATKADLYKTLKTLHDTPALPEAFQK
ncbi:DUF975 family protein [Lutibacter sp. B2]|nr:DUF975 family protein [Lutibacter sp. B2]